VRSGDTLSGIAQHYRGLAGQAAISGLIAANPQVKDPNLIYPGQKIRLAPPANREPDEKIP
jgi:LysM repeat protein